MARPTGKRAPLLLTRTNEITLFVTDLQYMMKSLLSRGKDAAVARPIGKRALLTPSYLQYKSIEILHFA